MNLAVEKALAIQGWMSPWELEWLCQMAATRTVIVEVGSWKGRSTKALAMSTPGVVYAIDHWKGSLGELDKDHQEAVSRGSDWLYGVFRQNLEDEINRMKVVPIRSESSAAAPLLTGMLGHAQADMIFIDAEHSYEAACRDIALYRNFLRPGGLLAGHDYEPGGPGVIRAVNELVPGFSQGPGSIWFRG